MAAPHCHSFLTRNPRSLCTNWTTHPNLHAETQSTCRSENAPSICDEFTAFTQSGGGGERGKPEVDIALWDLTFPGIKQDCNWETGYSFGATTQENVTQSQEVNLLLQFSFLWPRKISGFLFMTFHYLRDDHQKNKKINRNRALLFKLLSRENRSLLEKKIN